MTLAALAAAALVGLTFAAAAGKPGQQPKYTIKEVMQKAHKGDLLKKVLSGKASQEEKEELVLGYTALSLQEPPKGDLESWKKKTNALVMASKAVLKDDTNTKALAQLKAAANCTACHKEHRP
jgi:hypothetical protein